MSYETDLYAWTQQQGDALRRRAANEIDWDNLAEEIESVGRSDVHEMESRLEVLLLHLLKWRYQPDCRSGRWRSSIREARYYRIGRTSLRTYPNEYLPEAYNAARSRALDETGLLSVPDACPWPIDDILNDEFLP